MPVRRRLALKAKLMGTGGADNVIPKFVEFFPDPALLVIVLTLMLIGAGAMSFRELPIDAFPDVSRPRSSSS